METQQYTPEEFYQLAYRLGLTEREVRGLRSHRLFPPTLQKGKGYKKGKRYYYTSDSVSQLNTLNQWLKQPSARNHKDLRWYLWLYGGWDWLWDDVRKDLLELFPWEKLEPEDEGPAITLMGKVFSEGRSKLFKGSQIEVWKMIAPSIIRPFIEKQIAKLGTPPLGQTAKYQVIEFPEELDLLLGEGSHNAYQWLIDNNLYSIYILEQSIKKCSQELAMQIRPHLQEIESAWDTDEELIVVKRILGMRPLRSMGLQRMTRAISVSTLLLLNANIAKRDG